MIVYGARCTWWGTADEAVARNIPTGHCPACGKIHHFAMPLACQRGVLTADVLECPNCTGGLLAASDDQQWYEGVGRHPIIGWARGRCYPTFADLTAAYTAVNA